MKNIKRIITLLLALALLLPGAGAFRAGAAESPYMHFDSIFSIGDSNCMGYGLDGFKGGIFDDDGWFVEDTEFTNTEIYLHGVPGTYTDLVRETLGLTREDCDVMNYTAFRIKDALYYLDAGEEDDFYRFSYKERYQHSDRDAFGEDFIYDPTGTKNDPSKSAFLDRVKKEEGNRKLIINGAGLSDFFYALYEQSADELKELEPSELPAFAETVIQRIWDAHTDFKKDYPALIERLRELNPDAVIVLLGVFNGYANIYLTDNSLLPLANAVRIVTDLLNEDIKAFAEQYGCKYVDISNVETYALGEEISLFESFFGNVDGARLSHFSPEGHQYVTRQILEALKLEPEDHENNIVVDLGRFEKVDCVTVDGLPVNYRMDGSVLTVPCSRTTAKLLSVAIRNDDGTLSLAVYYLSFHNGYWAGNIYSHYHLGSGFQ